LLLVIKGVRGKFFLLLPDVVPGLLRRGELVQSRIEDDLSSTDSRISVPLDSASLRHLKLLVIGSLN
jgi:hypothetical protein